jgi:hypothetical protein
LQLNGRQGRRLLGAESKKNPTALSDSRFRGGKRLKAFGALMRFSLHDFEGFILAALLRVSEMANTTWQRWLGKFGKRMTGSKPKSRLSFSSRRAPLHGLMLEALEDRLVPNGYTVSNLADSGSGSLRQAILSANAQGGINSIQFANFLVGTISLTSGPLTITSPVAIYSFGADRVTVNGDNAGRVFVVNANASLSGLEITGGNGAGVLGGGIIVEDGAALYLTQCYVTNNSADYAGGIQVNSGSSLTAVDSTFANNQSTKSTGGGGAVFVQGTATISNCTFANNSSVSDGGALQAYNGGSITIQSSTISANTSSQGFGGGIRNINSTVSLVNTIVAGNSALSGPDIDGAVSSLGHNLVGNVSGSSGLGVTGDLLNVNPALGSLLYNGGPVPTMALPPGSPAIGAGGNTLGANVNGAQPDPAKWTTNTNTPQGGASVTVQNGNLQLQNRGYCNTVEQYNPVNGGIEITGTWEFGGNYASGDNPNGDLLEIITRSDGAPSGAYGETANGVQFQASQINNRITISGNGSAAVNGGSWVGVYLPSNYVFAFDIIDDGSNLTFTITNTTNAADSGTVTATCSTQMASNFITFHNREQDGSVTHTSLLGNVNVRNHPTGATLLADHFGNRSAPVLDERGLARPTTSSIDIGALESEPTGSTLVEGAAAGSDSYSFAAPTFWQASSQASWLHITSNASGSGDSTIQFSFDANTGPARTGVIILAYGVVLTVVQAGSGYQAAAAPLAILANNGAGNIYSLGGAVAMDASGDVYFVLESGGGQNNVCEWNAATRAVGIVASTNQPCYNVAVDASGNVYFTTNYWGSSGTNTVSTINEWHAASGQVTSLYTNPVPSEYGLNDDIGGLAVDSSGNLYFTDAFVTSSYQNYWQLDKWSATTGSVTDLVSQYMPLVGTSNPFFQGTESGYGGGIALGADGSVYGVVPFNTSGVAWYNPRSGSATQILGQVMSGFAPDHVAVDSSGDLYFTSAWVGNEISEWSPSANALSTISPPVAGPYFACIATNNSEIAFACANNQLTLSVGELATRTLVPGSISVAATGGTSSLSVLPSAELQASAFGGPSSSVPWIQFSPSGSGVLTYSVSPNGTPTSRTGQITVLGETVSVSQTGGLPVVSSPTSASITATSATLGGDVINSGDGAPVTLRGIFYAPTAVNSDPTQANGGTEVDDSAGGTGTFADSVTGLLPGTNYSFTAFAENAVGFGYSQADTFTTAKGNPTVTVTDNGGTYNGKAFAATNASVTGVGGAVIASFGSPLLSYNYYSSTGTQLAGPPTNAGICSVQVVFAGNANYNSATSSKVAFTIGKASLTYTIGNDSQSYGHPANLAQDLGSTIATGVNNESLDIVYASTGDTATAKVGTDTITGTLSNGTGLVANYNVTLKFGVLTVNPYAFTYDIGNDSATYGTPANLAKDLPATFATGVNGESLGITYKSTGDNATAHVASYSITGAVQNDTGVVSNYAVTLVAGTLTVHPYAFNYTIHNDHQTYGHPANLATTLPATILTGVNSQNLKISYVSTGDTASAHVGTYAISATLANGTGLTTDYTVTLTNGTLTVNPYQFSYTIGNDSEVYGSPANFAGDLGTTIATGVNGESLKISYSSIGDTASAHVGTYAISATLTNGTGLTTDYTATLTNGTLRVNRYQFSYTIGNDTQVYGSPANLTADLPSTIATGVNGQNLKISYASSGDAASADVGTYAISATLANGTGLTSDYSVTLTDGTLTVNPYQFSYTIGNDSGVYGSPANLPSDLGTTIATGVNGQNLTIAYSSNGDTATAHVADSPYAITGVLSDGTGTLSDYAVTLQNGSLTVNPYAFTYQIGNDSQTYGSPANLAADLGTTIPTGVNGENLAIAYGSMGDNGTAHVADFPYAITGVLSDGTGTLSDYAVTLQNGSLTVNPYAFTYQIGNDSQTYGNPANLAADLGTTILTGVNGENLAITYASIGDNGTAHVANSPYAITGVLSDGTGTLGDYTVTLQNGSLTVNPYAFTYQIGNVSQTYGSPANLAADLGTTIPTGINDETLAISYSSAGDAATANAESYPITGALADGTGQAADYTVTLTSGNLIVNPYAFTYQIGNDSQIDGNPANLTADLGTTISTGVNGETLAIGYTSVGDTASAGVGTYPITGALSDGSGLLANYDPTSLGGTLTVQPPVVTAGIAGPLDGVSFQPRTFQFSAVELSGTSAGFTYTINWGDGSALETVGPQLGNSPVHDTHAYAGTGTFAVSVTATDQAGISSPVATQQITIGVAELEHDSASLGGITGLAIAGTSAGQGIVLASAGPHSIRVTRGGILLGAFVPPGGGVTIYGDGGNDLVTVLGAANLVDTFTLTGSTATFAAGSSGATTFTIGLSDISAVAFRGGAVANSFTITQATVASTLLGGTGSNSYALAGGSAGVATTIKGAGTANTLTGPALLDSQTNVWTVDGPNRGTLNGGSCTFVWVQNLVGGPNGDHFQFVATGSIAGRLDGGATATLDFSGDTQSTVSVNLATGQATSIGGGFKNVARVIGQTSSAGPDTLTLAGSNSADVWGITGPNSGTVNGVGFAGFANLRGGKVADDFVFSANGGVTGTVYGGSGVNRLDYSAFGAAVYVNLLAAVATGTGGVVNIQQVIGSGLGDVLVGNHSGELLQESVGNNLIIGGATGGVTLDSGSGQDIVIAGSTSYDTDQAALEAIETFWSTNGGTFAQRTAALSSGAAGYALNKSTVQHHSGAGDTIALGSAKDWLFWRQVGTGADFLTGTPEQSTFV